MYRSHLLLTAPETKSSPIRVRRQDEEQKFVELLLVVDKEMVRNKSCHRIGFGTNLNFLRSVRKIRRHVRSARAHKGGRQFRGCDVQAHRTENSAHASRSVDHGR